MNVLPEIYHILASVHSKQPLVPGALMYNQRWLLRLVLAAERQGLHCLPFRFADGARWFSETMLYTAFGASSLGDTRAEPCTAAGGVVGHFDFPEGGKLGLHLSPLASQFVVCEAKLFSPLSGGEPKTRGFDQAARTVACMAYTLKLLGDQAPEEFDWQNFQSLGFYLLAPVAQIKAGGLKERLDPGSLRDKIRKRIHGYPEPQRSELKEWMEDWVIPLLDHPRFEAACVSWEAILKRVQRRDKEYGQDLQEFYFFCKKYHRYQSPGACLWASPEGEQDVILVKRGEKYSRVRFEDGRETMVSNETVITLASPNANGQPP
ncbi:MAG: hypothetical protein JO112_00995 [Planctomycetes bacterium]|nr:hypothetical protein [Planctomycetota bacterium]